MTRCERLRFSRHCSRMWVALASVTSPCVAQRVFDAERLGVSPSISSSATRPVRQVVSSPHIHDGHPSHSHGTRGAFAVCMTLTIAADISNNSTHLTSIHRQMCLKIKPIDRVHNWLRLFPEL